LLSIVSTEGFILVREILKRLNAPLLY
jgi:hypothetical protein